MKITAQSFENPNNAPFSKATVRLWNVNAPPLQRFQIGGDAVFIDALNFAKLVRGGRNIRHNPFSPSSTGSGSLSFLGSNGSSGDTKIVFPCQVEEAGLYYLTFSFRSVDVNISYKLWINNDLVADDTAPNAAFGTYENFTVPIVIPDERPFELSFSTSTSLDLDYLCVSKTSSIPAVNYVQKPYITLHAGIYALAGGSPASLQQCYDVKTTYSDLDLDDEYNFNVSAFSGSTVNYSQDFAFSLFSVGSTESSYLVWDTAANADDPYSMGSFVNTGSGWNTSDIPLSLTVWSFVDSFDAASCSLQTISSDSIIQTENTFSDARLQSVFSNTEVQSDDEGNKVALKLPDRIISLLLDESGSMTWNDNPKLRHQMIRRLINRLDSTYPGKVKFNLYTFGATPVRVSLFAVTETDNINTSDSSAVARSFFQDQESGYSGVRVVRKVGSHPVNAIDGDIISEGFIDRSFDDNLQSQTEYFYSIFTFDSLGTYSEGKEIQATPNTRLIPTGIGNFDVETRIGTGVRVDDSVVAAWHFDEASGARVLDFSPSQSHLEYQLDQDPIWLNDKDVPSGSSGVRLNGSNAYFVSSAPSVSSLMGRDEFTIMAFVSPFDTFASNDQFLFVERKSNDSTGLQVQINGQNFSIRNASGIAVQTNTSPLVIGSWNHIAITYRKATNSVSMYANGSLVATGSFSDTSVVDIDEFCVGGSSVSELPDPSALFGKLTEVSLHSVARDSSYILDAADIPDKAEDKISDNGDRILAFSYTVPEDFNYAGGYVRVIEKEDAGELLPSIGIDGNAPTDRDGGFGDEPFFENEGSVIYEESASPGSYFFTISKPFIHGRRYHYRIFTQNSIGNFSLWSDSPLESITIPSFSSFEDRANTIDRPSLPIVTNLSVQEGNKKNYITWSLNSLNNFVQEVMVYYSSRDFPIVTADGQSDGELIFRGNPDQNGFVHRNLENNEQAFYAVITSDQYNYASEPSYASATPNESADETGIPLLEVRHLRYELVGERSISLAWSQPVIFESDVEGWFDQRVALFAQITDELGAPLADASRLRFVAEGKAVSANNSEDVFGDEINRDLQPPTFKDATIITSSLIGSSTITGIFRMADDFDILSSLSSVTATISIQYTVPDKKNPAMNAFEFNSEPITIKLSNPFNMELVNQSGDLVEHVCKELINLGDFETIATGGLLVPEEEKKIFNGCYIRRNRPFVARAKATYKGEAINTDAKVFVAVHEASDPECDDLDSTPKFIFEPTFFSTKSRTVIPPATTLDLQPSSSIDDEGNIDEFSFADIPLPVPDLPQGVMLFAEISYNGYTARRKMYIAFENILRIEVQAEPPVPDCVDVSEQRCRVYLIDPDTGGRRSIPDNEVVKWTLRKGRTGKDLPFYSLDNLAGNGSGVFSRLRGGSARNVFFGPACNVRWELVLTQFGLQALPQIYSVLAEISYDGLYAFDDRPAFIFPQQVSDRGGPRFLMHLSSFVKSIWADGLDSAKLTIWRDPNQAPSNFSSIFTSCASQLNFPVLVLNSGQNIEIETLDNLEIFFGEDLEVSIDPYSGYLEFQGGQQETGFATVSLTSDSSVDVYFRQNENVGFGYLDEGDGGDEEHICNSITVPKLTVDAKPVIISGRTTSQLGEDFLSLEGGGSPTYGIPPTVLLLKEPLKSGLYAIKRNDEIVSDLLIDGQTSHQLLVFVSFRDEAVPDGTPVRIAVAGESPQKLNIVNQVAFTQAIPDPFFESEGIPDAPLVSIAQFDLLPIDPSQAFNAQIVFDVTYDERGDIDRRSRTCFNVSYLPEIDFDPPAPDPTPEPDEPVNNLYDGTIDVFDSQSQIWSVLPNDLTHPRGALTLNYNDEDYGGALYALGGIDGNKITRYNERYPLYGDKWQTLSSMGRARFFHTSQVVSNRIYVFGGISSSNGSLLVLSSSEKYDIYSDEWSFISDLPSIESNNVEVIYSLAMASSIVVGQEIFLIGGIRLIAENGSISELNNRIIVYNTVTDSYRFSEVFEEDQINLYQRVSPFLFYDTDANRIRVSGGAVPVGDGKDERMEFLTTSFSVDPATLSIASDETVYLSPPEPRYKGSFASIGDDHYFLGGENRRTKVSRTFEVINSSAEPFDITSLDGPEIARQSFGLATDGQQYLYMAGGITSGRPPGFLQINAIANPSRIRLDGKESAGIDIDLLDDVGERPTKDIRILLRGFLVFAEDVGTDDEDDLSGGGGGSDQDQQDSVERINEAALIYPVIFSNNEIIAKNGFASTTLLPRSEDILDKVKEIEDRLSGRIDEDIEEPLVINYGEIRNSYQIRIQITVVDDFYYGQTVVDFEDNEDPEEETEDNSNQDTPDEEPPVEEPIPDDFFADIDPYSPIFESCRRIGTSVELPADDPADDPDDSGGGFGGLPGGPGSGSDEPIDDGLKDRDNPVFDLNPPQYPQLESPTISYYSDISWIPQVKSYISDSQGTAQQALDALDVISNSVPFGGSPFYDGIYEVANDLLSEDLDPFIKVVYVQTDNEESLSRFLLEEAIEEVQSIDGFGKVPVLVNNFSVVFPLTLSALLARTDTDDLEFIAKETRGQSQTVLDATYLSEVLNNILGRAVGSVGWGSYQFVMDLGQNSIINSITLDFDLFDNTDGSWTVSSSLDGLEYSEISDQFGPNEEISFSNLNGRYLKFDVGLLSGLSASILEEYENIASPGVPALRSVDVEYSLPKKSYIYLNVDSSFFGAQQIALTVDASRPKGSEINVGVATSDSHSWVDYRTGSRPALNQHGRLFIPIRTEQDDVTIEEKLISVDGFLWKSLYGAWDPTSRVQIKNEAGDTLLDSEYEVFPREGFIVFKSKRFGSYTIQIENSSQFRIGIEVVNKFAEEGVDIRGVGYIYNTNVFLPPPLSERAPVVQNLEIVPENPSVYTKIRASYLYSDVNGDPEDLENTEIRWYINGVEFEPLRNLRVWNDIDDVFDPLWIYGFSFDPDDVPPGSRVDEFARTRSESLINVGDSVYFTVRPSDGENAGELVRSPAVEIRSAPPFVTDVVIVGVDSQGNAKANVTSSSIARASYGIFDNDESLTTIVWFVNGRQFKSGILGGSQGGFSNDEILPGEIVDGVLAISLGATLEVELRPSIGNTLFDPIRSEPVVVTNSVPRVAGVTISPSNPTSNSALELSYLFVDADVEAATGGQSDQSIIRWYKSEILPDGVGLFGGTALPELTEFRNQRIIPSSATEAGYSWFAEVTPFDGLSSGVTVRSNIVNIT